MTERAVLYEVSSGFTLSCAEVRRIESYHRRLKFFSTPGVNSLLFGELIVRCYKHCLISMTVLMHRFSLVRAIITLPVLAHGQTFPVVHSRVWSVHVSVGL